MPAGTRPQRPQVPECRRRNLSARRVDRTGHNRPRPAEANSVRSTPRRRRNPHSPPQGHPRRTQLPVTLQGTGRTLSSGAAPERHSPAHHLRHTRDRPTPRTVLPAHELAWRTRHGHLPPRSRHPDYHGASRHRRLCRRRPSVHQRPRAGTARVPPGPVPIQNRVHNVAQIVFGRPPKSRALPRRSKHQTESTGPINSQRASDRSLGYGRRVGTPPAYRRGSSAPRRTATATEALGHEGPHVL